MEEEAASPHLRILRIAIMQRGAALIASSSSRGSLLRELCGIVAKSESALFGQRTMSSSSSSDVVKRVSVQVFSDVLKKRSSGDSSASTIQVIDVREKHELELARLPASAGDVVNLPLSESSSWMTKIESGEILDCDAPTFVMCHHGVRSMRCAMLLVHLAGFADVSNVEGGIHAFAVEVDDQVGQY